VIISASYRTDIPAFHGDWFMERLRSGACKVRNPYSGQLFPVSLRLEDVDGFVFWTRNAAPFEGCLEEVARRAIPFTVQYTVTGYPRSLEPSVLETGRALDLLRRLGERYGPRVLVWRYDPILFTSLTPRSFHLETFARLSQALMGVTDEAVVSFAHVYRKTERHLEKLGAETGIRWWDPGLEEKRQLLTELAAVARRAGMTLSLCAQRELLVPGVEDAHCVDARRLAAVAGRPIGALQRGHRKDCGCYESRDSGAYDPCRHGCAYCYAVSDPARARQTMGACDPARESLGAPVPVPGATRTERLHSRQLDLFRAGEEEVQE